MKMNRFYGLVMSAVLLALGFSFIGCDTDGNNGGCEPIDIVLYEGPLNIGDAGIAVTFTEGTHINFKWDNLKPALQIFIDGIEYPRDGHDGPWATPWNITTFGIDKHSDSDPEIVTAGQTYKVKLVYTKPANAAGEDPFGYNHDLNGDFDPFIPMESFMFEKTVVAE